MAESSGFFNSSNGDRKYKAEFFAKYFATFISNGVFPNPSTNLQVVANNDMTVTVKAGPGWINGYVYFNGSDLILPIEVADGALNRIDRIVLQYNTTDRSITAKVKKGAFASSPVALDLQRDADAYELGLADVYIAAGATSIAQSNITDLRLDTTKCGIVHGTVEQVDTTTIFNQYQSWLVNTQNTSQIEIDNMESQFQSDWDSWFNSIKNALGTDIAGNLQQQINNHLADDKKHIDYAVTSGTNTYTATIPNITSLTEGLSIKIKFTNANTGTSTLNINSLGAKTIQKGNGNALASGNIKAGQICHLVYTGSVFQLLGEGGEYGTVTANKVLIGTTFGTESGLANGSMPNRAGTAQNCVDSASDSNGNLWLNTPEGYYNVGSSVKGYDSNFIPENIMNGKTIFGTTGTGNKMITVASNNKYINEVSPSNSSTNNLTYTKINKTRKMALDGTVRISIAVNTGASGGYFRIYKNGVPAGIERYVAAYSGTPVFVEDFSCLADDYFELFAKSESTSVLANLNTISFGFDLSPLPITTT
jgi:hypothetical protein